MHKGKHLEKEQKEEAILRLSSAHYEQTQRLERSVAVALSKKRLGTK